MTFAQLRRYIETIRKSGYSAEPLTVKLYEKTSWPFISVVMALIALPFRSDDLRAAPALHRDHPQVGLLRRAADGEAVREDVVAVHQRGDGADRPPLQI